MEEEEEGGGDGGDGGEGNGSLCWYRAAWVDVERRKEGKEWRKGGGGEEIVPEGAMKRFSSWN